MREYVARDFGRLVAALTVICGGRSVAEEVVQEALARAWQQELSGKKIESLSAWVATTAMNLARSLRRRLSAERRAHRLIDAGRSRVTASESEVGLTETRLDLIRAIQSLPRRQREVIALFYLADMDVRQVATSLGLSEGGVRALLFRARESLAKALDPTDRPRGQRR